MRGLVAGRYHALLGAGASMGGASGDGRPLPGAIALAAELHEEFSIPSGQSTDLRRTQKVAKSRTTQAGQTLAEYFRARFTETTPPDWMSRLTAIRWAQIWTLNVDDCVERAYSVAGQAAHQKLISISWTERHRTAQLAKGEVLLVHLHGKATRAHRSEGSL